ncbi:sushi, nidogen and EGF-like domain-containing protein 1 [Eublepharis macularius]|uniref:Sushi, nidogen and EGF-like domain-containing protein 1 n=1 Tax=Eublepharis macularius TaxID=481883 RepID=A0AA97KJ40_EUBMA|nr:sushi, nidogen and EGF-like domain-containing protein 1 [Eublepharis macularius]
METFCVFLLLAVGSTLTSPVQDSKDSLMYPYGPNQGDMENPKEDDGTSPEITLTEPFAFYGKQYHSLYVNNNGVVSFGVNVSQYTPDPFPLDGGSPFVAPFWGDVDTRIAGKVYWRQTRDQAVLRRCTADINQYFPEVPFVAVWALIATWDHVAFFRSASKKVNTFQAVLTTDGNIAFIMLNYADIQWTTGPASGGDPKTGLGGIPAQAGFDSGDKIHYYNIPSSRTADVVNIGGTTNVGVPGRWVFQVDEFVAAVTTESIDCLL